jgi:hypothetical protein
MTSYDDVVARCCQADPIINTTLIVGYETKFTLTVKVYRSDYGDNGKFLYYYLNCPEPCDDKSHPFYHIIIHNIKMKTCWNVIADNSMVLMVLKYIAMEDDELSKLSGHKHPTAYRSQLIRLINNLWD